MNKTALVFGAAFAFLSVALGAFGAHGLKSYLTPEMLAVWHTAVQYQMFHSLSLLILGVMAKSFRSGKMLIWAMRLMVLGVILFSGSLYALSLTGLGKLGMITPFGGLSFLLAWLLVFVVIWSSSEAGNRL